ncbi:hypothetical protein BKA56DRAFT_579637 [Ilyonectria sp. MPI-CAGE-AT-0026]|nr:hypothetical protein BKA56DRAFT_579637 [Ilyonectria sp. MPI-CAGE-AT-0026]
MAAAAPFTAALLHLSLLHLSLHLSLHILTPQAASTRLNWCKPAVQPPTTFWTTIAVAGFNKQPPPPHPTQYPLQF